MRATKKKKIISILPLTILTYMLVLSAFALPVFSKPAILDPLTIPKWVNQLDGPPPVYVPTNVTNIYGEVIRQDYVVSVAESYQQILPTVDANGNPTGFGPTKIWGYGGEAKDAITGRDLGMMRTVPGPMFEAIRGIPIQVKWINDLVDAGGNPLQHMFPVDPTIHWANPNNIDMDTAKAQTVQGLAPPFPPGYNGAPYTLPGTSTVTNPEGWNAQSPVPIVTHLHGGEEQSEYDGTPDQWFTPNGIHGQSYRTAIPTDPNAAVYYYPNVQPPTALWYHDHALGMTRINVLSGLAGYYILRDPADSLAPLLPSGQYEMPLIFQDRTFLTDGSLYYPADGYYPSYGPPPFNYTQVNPYGVGGFLGNTIMVNGKVWPNMNVHQGQYRFRILSASNSRFYNFSFSNGMSFTQIGSDGGYLKAPVSLTYVLISPAERVDILVDFSNIAPGEKIILQNKALVPPVDLPTQRLTVGQIMQFTVTTEKGFEPKSLPSQLNPTLAGDFPSLPTPTKVRTLTLGENIEVSPSLPMDLYLDGQEWAAPISETPALGTTEDWVFVNTFDTHNMHLHLIQFQLVSRQKFNLTAYWNDWLALNGGMPPFNHTTVNVPSLEPYLIDEPIPPQPEEQGWKDTMIVFSRQITTIRVRFAQQDGSDFPFDATAGPGYVWHCHILEHEDNEMMRPYVITRTPELATQVLIFIAVLIIIVVIGFLGLKRLKSRSYKKETHPQNPRLLGELNT
jgi:FtsP/CotA-like multicopper oxidase with cupredoxin domain